MLGGFPLQTSSPFALYVTASTETFSSEYALNAATGAVVWTSTLDDISSTFVPAVSTDGVLVYQVRPSCAAGPLWTVPSDGYNVNELLLSSPHG